MLEVVGLENILWFIVISIAVIAFQIDRLSRRMVGYIDDLQDRVDELEKRVGSKEEVNIDALGFVREEK